MKRPFFWVDAFASRKLAGNPCAVVLDADGLDDETMLAVAREMNLSETAFVQRSARCDYRARYFTPEREIPLAGHPTIATAHALLESGRASDESLTLELTAGPVKVGVKAGEDGRWLTMEQLPPRFLREYAAERVLPVFGLDPADALASAPIQTVSTGTPMLMAPLRRLEALKRAKMDVPAYLRLREAGDFFSPHFFCLDGATPAGQTFARHFGVPPDTLEDPFTGSATGCMGAYLWRYGLIERPSFVAEQGHWMGRPGTARVEIAGPRETPALVRVAGRAVTLVRGEIDLS